MQTAPIAASDGSARSAPVVNHRRRTAGAALLAVGLGALAAIAASGLDGAQAAKRVQAGDIVDFDGDGRGDLAVSALGTDLSTGQGGNHGAVVVRYGIEPGTARDTREPQRLTAAEPAAGDGFGIVVRTGNFNSDRFRDLAVSATGATVGGFGNAGSVRVFYGSGTGLVPGPTLGGRCAPVDAGQEFGRALAAGDLDGDRIDELAVAIARVAPGARAPAGAVAVFRGTVSGLEAECRTLLADHAGSGSRQHDAHYGSAVEIGDLDDDRIGDLVIGAPGELVAGVATGAVHVAFGCQFPCRVGDRRTALRPQAGVLGDSFGFSLALGEFGRGDTVDLAVGSPGADVDGVRDAGAVAVFYGPVESGREVRITRNTSGVSGSAQGRVRADGPCPPLGCAFPDSFGRTMAAGRLGSGRWDSLIVGIQFADVDKMVDAGAVHVFPGAATGLRLSEGTGWHGQSAGEFFGSAIVVTTLGEGRQTGLAVAAPRADVAGFPDAGAVDLLFDGSGRRRIDAGRHVQAGQLFGGILSRGLG